MFAIDDLIACDISTWKIYVMSRIVGYMSYIAPEFMTNVDMEFDFVEEISEFVAAIVSERDTTFGVQQRYEYYELLSEARRIEFWHAAIECARKACDIMRENMDVPGAHVGSIDAERKTIEIYFYQCVQ